MNEDTDQPASPSVPQPHLGRLGGLVAGAPVVPRKIKKPNEALTLKVVGDLQIGYLHRKLVNVMMRVAQDEKQPGRRLPPNYPPEDRETAREYFWAPLEEFVRDASYDSNDTKVLKTALQELQQLKVTSDGTEWLSEVPIPSVRIIAEPGHSSWVGFAFAPETKRLVMRPRQYTEILLQMQKLLSSGPALALYEKCRSYLTSPGHKTARAPWTDWFYWLSGQPTSKAPPPFKYWNRDTLKRIEAEINAVTDIRIERVEYRVGRHLEDLQYRVFENPQMRISFPGKPPIDTALLKRLLDLRIPAERANRYIAEYDEGRLRANLAYTEAAFKRGEIKRTPEQYLKAALEKNFAGNAKTAEASLAIAKERAQEPDPNRLTEAFLAHRATEAWGLFKELDADAQASAVQAFLALAHESIRSQYDLRGLQSPLVKNDFARHYAQAVWGDPTDDELLKFANRKLATAEDAARPE